MCSAQISYCFFFVGMCCFHDFWCFFTFCCTVRSFGMKIYEYWHREDDGAVVLCRDAVQGLEVAELGNQSYLFTYVLFSC